MKNCRLEESFAYEIGKEVAMKLLGTIRCIVFMFAASREPTGESCCIDTTDKSSM
jgi:hypothetical protein